ncbi:hypothetical protein CWS_01925 [Buchnera aphidicola str. JF99 (Acyrthosiphon pisum)]|nr:hypothetical protein CWS_01925 [Buchnera aphidicola str. JF99 (Acyrthosiphon pisum)]ADP67859.1 hypothetical protein CWU_02405 [Buchnera aphidicola str. JF98 (Acyrthosiphon pisum)]
MILLNFIKNIIYYKTNPALIAIFKNIFLSNDETLI